MTGGGFPENIPRVIPKGLQCRVQKDSWQVPPLFKWLQKVFFHSKPLHSAPDWDCLGLRLL